MTLLPDVNKARILPIPLQIIVDDWLNTHGAAKTRYTLSESPHPLRQEDLPSDAKVIFAYLDQDDTKRTAVLEKIREMLNHALMILPSIVPEGAEDDLVLSRLVSMRNDAQTLLHEVTDALTLTPARHLMIGIESNEFEAVPRGEEPLHYFDHRHFLPKRIKEH